MDIADDNAWRRLIEAAQGWSPPVFPLRGRDVLALGFPPGPRIGDLLNAVEAWWIAGDFKADRAQCLSRLEALIGLAAS